MNGTGMIRVTLTDPPSCAFPNGSFDHVFVTIRSVQAHVSATAGDNDPGWQELAPQLNAQPMQIDLFSASATACLLSTLGSNDALPAGAYQQIRLLLVANSGASVVPATNACGNQGYNCVVLHDGTVYPLQLSSQANTGLKIPPGQILGGPITVKPGEDVDLNIDFNACASILREGNGEFRLKPVLTAGQVSANRTGISGQVVDAATGKPIVGGTVMVAVEQQGAGGQDVVIMQTAADASGDFNFCPLPSGNTYDLVADAVDGAGVAYNATVAIGVPGGTNLGAIALYAETSANPGPATFQGFVTATTGTSAASIDAAASALQSVTLSGGSARLVVVPAEVGSMADFSVKSSANCPATAPLNSNCGQYTLVEPASNPSVGEFASGQIKYNPPSAGVVPYTIGVNAFVPMSGGLVDCSPSSKSTSTDVNKNPLLAVPATTVTPREIDFSGCS
ncbi:MAG: DUF4382 domain-containing protein [Acidobacteriota bacterium]|nr:DUF4382 domain-containing protein [Acidobacteriota bacterium]